MRQRGNEPADKDKHSNGTDSGTDEQPTSKDEQSKKSSKWKSLLTSPTITTVIKAIISQYLK